MILWVRQDSFRTEISLQQSIHSATLANTITPVPPDNYDCGRDSGKIAPGQLAVKENKNLLTPEQA